MYIIFINDCVIYLAQKPIGNKQVLAKKYNEIDLETVIEKLETNALKSIFIYHDDLEGLWRDFKAHCTVIEAAGGLVFNEKDETLWIYRHNTWDLPKGKVEANENLEEAALREVSEECGVTGLVLVAPMQETYHMYNLKGRRVLKITHWYQMFANSDQNLSPQLEENITKVVWLDLLKTKKVLENTYDNIKLLCRFAPLK